MVNQKNIIKKGIKNKYEMETQIYNQFLYLSMNHIRYHFAGTVKIIFIIVSSISFCISFQIYSQYWDTSLKACTERETFNSTCNNGTAPALDECQTYNGLGCLSGFCDCFDTR